MNEADPPAVADGDSPDPDEDARNERSVRKLVVRAAVLAIALGVAGFLLFKAFDDLDIHAVLDAMRSLDDAERLSLIFGTAIVIWSEALLLASFVPKMPARRGGMAWLGSTAVASVIPGPSDVPVVYRMFKSWGQTSADAATAIAGASLFNIGLKLILPAVAGVAIVVADIPLGGVMSTIITATVILALLLLGATLVLGSERRTAAAGRAIDRVWRPILRLLRRRPPDRPLADRLVVQRAESLELMNGIWQRSLATILLVTATRVALFVMCIRFVGVPGSAASWVSIFCVWAIVRGLTVIPIMPGGVGVSEFAYVAMLTAIAGSRYVNEITAGVLIYRILTWLLIIPAGGVALGLWQMGLRRGAEERARREAELNPAPPPPTDRRTT